MNFVSTAGLPFPLLDDVVPLDREVTLPCGLFQDPEPGLATDGVCSDAEIVVVQEVWFGCGRSVLGADPQRILGRLGKLRRSVAAFVVNFQELAPAILLVVPIEVPGFMVGAIDLDFLNLLKRERPRGP